MTDQLNAGVCNTAEQLSPEFVEALKHHQLCLEQFGEDDPRSVEAAIVCLTMMPASWSAEILQMAFAQRH